MEASRTRWAAQRVVPMIILGVVVGLLITMVFGLPQAGGVAESNAPSPIGQLMRPPTDCGASALNCGSSNTPGSMGPSYGSTARGATATSVHAAPGGGISTQTTPTTGSIPKPPQPPQQQPPPPAPNAAPALSPPTSISDTCASDATAALNAWIAHLPQGSTISLPTNGCYLVSNSDSSLLTISGTHNLTINGNGTTFQQRNYDSSGDPQAGVLTLGNNIGFTLNNVTLRGPSSSGGSSNEGDMGALLYQNYVVTFNSVTITNVEGDGLDIYPRGNDPGVNWYVTVNHSIITNVGYHALVPEAVDHFTFENSVVTNGDIDAEVDFSCEGDLPNCGTLANPSIGVVNMTMEGNWFPNGITLEDGMSCMPVGNWTIEGNNFGTGGFDAQFDTTYSLSLSALLNCGKYSGLTIENNTSTATTQYPCCGSGSPYILVQGWTNVTVTGNHFVYAPNRGADGSSVFDLWGDSNVSITNNAFLNYYNISAEDAPAGWPATTGVAICRNTTGLAQSPSVQTACPG